MISYLSGAMENAKNDGADWRQEITLWLIENLNHITPSNFQSPGDQIWLLGETFSELGGSCYQEFCSGRVFGNAPKLELDREKRLQEAVENLANLHRDWRNQQKDLYSRREKFEEQQRDLQARFGEQRRARDLLEAEVAKQRQQLQEAKWNLERLRQNQQSLLEEIRSSSVRLEELEKQLPKH